MESSLTGLTQGDFTLLRVLSAAGVMTDILTLIGSGGGGGGITTLLGSGAAVISGSGSTRTITVDLSAFSNTTSIYGLLANYTLTSSIATQMAAKIDTLTAASGIAISGVGTSRTISATGGGSSIILQVDGAVQAATTLNFLANNAALVGNVLNVSRLTYYDKIALRYSGAASDLDLNQATSGVLTWGGPSLELRHATGVSQKLTVDSGGNLNVGNDGIVTVPYLNAWNTPEFTRIDLKDSGGTVRPLTPSLNGSLVYGNPASQLIDLNDLSASLVLKQDELVGVSTGSTYLIGPAHHVVSQYAFSWTNSGTYSVFTSNGTGHDQYDSVATTVGTALTIKVDVKLVGSSSVFVIAFEMAGGNLSKTYSSADGLNTSTYTTLSLSTTATSTSFYWQLGFQVQHSGLQPAAGDVYHLQDVSVEKGGGLSVASDLTVGGTLNVTGTKNFLIDHPNTTLVPDDGKKWKLRHTCIESDEPYLMYRMTVDMTSSSQVMEMPKSWFPHLVTDVCVHMSPYRHFGSGWGEVAEDGYTFTLHASTVGQWHVLITGLRNDECGRLCAASPIEFQEAVRAEPVLPNR